MSSFIIEEEYIRQNSGAEQESSAKVSKSVFVGNSLIATTKVDFNFIQLSNIGYKFAFETFSICPVKYASSCLSCCANSNPF